MKRQYSFTDTIVVVNGVEVVGWAKGDDVIDISRREDSVSDEVGAAGDMMISVNADKSGVIKFTLQQSSPTNAYFGGLLDIQEATGSAFVPIIVLFRDTYRNDMASGSSGYIKQTAGFKRGAKATNQTWEIVVERLDLVYGVTA